jgi:hypothetical protein
MGKRCCQQKKKKLVWKFGENELLVTKRNEEKKSHANYASELLKLHLPWNYYIMICSNKGEQIDWTTKLLFNQDYGWSRIRKF